MEIYSYTSGSWNHTGMTVQTVIDRASFPAPNPLWLLQLLQLLQLP